MELMFKCDGRYLFVKLRKLKNFNNHSCMLCVDVYEMEKICGAKVVNGQPLYLVKWLGYPESENTWEPPSNILHKQFIDNWKKSKGTC